MKTIELTIDEDLPEEIDRATHSLDVSRETFIQTALRRALREHAPAFLEQQHARGYARRPSRPTNSTSGRPTACGVSREAGRGLLVHFSRTGQAPPRAHPAIQFDHHLRPSSSSSA